MTNSLPKKQTHLNQVTSSTKNTKGISQPIYEKGLPFRKKKRISPDFVPLSGHRYLQPHQMNSFKSWLDQIRKKSKNEREKGTFFEKDKKFESIY